VTGVQTCALPIWLLTNVFIKGFRIPIVTRRNINARVAWGTLVKKDMQDVIPKKAKVMYLMRKNFSRDGSQLFVRNFIVFF